MPEELEPTVQTMTSPDDSEEYDSSTDQAQVDEGAERLFSEMFGSLQERLQRTEPAADVSTSMQFYDSTNRPVDILARSTTGMIFGVRRTEFGAVQVDIFDTPQAARNSQPVGRLSVSRSEDSGRRTEIRDFYDLSSSSDVPTGTTNVSYDELSGELMLSTSAGDRSHNLTMLDGKPTHLRLFRQSSDRDDAVTFDFANGQITDVHLNGVKLSGDQRLNFIRAAESTILEILRENELPTDGFRSALPPSNPQQMLDRLVEATEDEEQTSFTSFESEENDETDEHQAPEAARNGDGLIAGTFDGPDGSRIEYARSADGTIRPRSIRYSDGSSTEYTYNDRGRVTEVANKNREGQVRSRIFSEDGGTTYQMQAGATRLSGMQGTLNVRDDGTMRLTVPGAQPAQSQTFETNTQGELIRSYRAGDGPREVRLRTNGSEAHFRVNGENRSLVLEVLQDGVRVERIPGPDGRPSAVVVTRPGRPLGTYMTTDGGTNWTELPGNRRGTLTLEQGRLPVFRPADVPAQPPEVQEGAQPTDRPGAPPAERARFLQARVTSLLDTVYQPRFQAATQRVLDAARDARRDMSSPAVHRAIQQEIEQAHRQVTEEMERDRQALARESEVMRTSDNPELAWRNSPVTLRLYRDLVRSLETESIPATMRQLAGAHAREFPPGSPQTVPQHLGLFLIPELFRQQAASGTLPQPDFRIPGTRDGDSNPLRLPTDADLASLGRGLDWLVTARRQMDRARLDYELNHLLPGIISTNRLPGNWLQEVGENPESRREALMQMTELATTIRNYSNAIIALRLDETRVAQLPPGHHARITGSGTNRRLEALNLDLPQTLDMQDPNNLRRIEELQRWVSENRGAINEALAGWERSIRDPSRQLFYGEIETRGVVLRDAQHPDRPERILDPNNPEHQALIRNSPGRTSGFNLLSCGFTVSRQPDGIYVSYNTQPQDAHWYNYLNVGATDVGQPFTERRGPFQPGDPLAVRDGSGQLHMVRAEDLGNWLNEQKLLYWGSKALTVTMDVGMVVAGIASGGTAAAAYQAGAIGARVLATRVGVGLLRAGLGASGFLLNNAAVHTDPFWRHVDEARGLAMIFDVTQGTARGLGGGALRILRGGQMSAGALRAAQMSERIEQAIANSNWIIRGMNRAEQGAHLAMEFSNPLFAPIILRDINQQWNVVTGGADGDPLARALRLMGNRDDQREAPRNVDEAMRQAALEQTRQVMDTYLTQLSRGQDQPTRERLEQILRRTRELLNPDSPQADKDRFKQELLDLMYGSGDGLGEQIAGAETRRNDRLAAETIRTQQRTGFSPNPALQTAAATAFLLLSQGADGRIQESAILSSRPITIPAHTITVDAGGEGGTATVTIPERTVQQTLTARDVLDRLRTDATRTDAPSRRMVVGELLVRSTARSPLSFARILTETLNNPNAQTEERMEAIVRIGPMINALQLLERRGMSPAERQQFLAESYGVSANDLEGALRRVAGDQAQSRDVRTMAGAVLHNLRGEFSPEQLRENFNALAREFTQRAGEPGTFADFYIARLGRERAGEDRTTRLGAILTLRELGDLGGLTNNIEYNQAMVSCMDRNNPQLSMVALASLQIRTPAQDLRPADRTTIINLLAADRTAHNGQLKAEIIRRMGDFAETLEEKARAGTLLCSLLDPQADQVHAVNDPLLRAAAIGGLAELNIRTSVLPTVTEGRAQGGVLLRHLNMTHEPDARVRLAAVQALERMHAPNLHQIAMDHLATESDAAVRARLVDVRSQNVRPVRDQAYMERVQQHWATLAGSLDNNVFNACNWLINHPRYNLLNDEAYGTYRNQRADDNDGNSFTRWFLNEDQELLRNSSNITAWQERQAQFQNLVRDAQANTPEGREARQALVFIAIGENPPFESRNVPIYREWACQQIANLCRSGTEIRGEFLKGIRMGLNLPLATLSARSKEHLLDALGHFVENTPAGPANALQGFLENSQRITVDQVVRAYATANIRVPPAVHQALQTYAGIRNPTPQDTQQVVDAVSRNVDTSSALYRQIAAVYLARSLESCWDGLPKPPGHPQAPPAGESGYPQALALQRRILTTLAGWNHREIYPALEAAITQHPYPEIREQARQTLADMRDRIEPILTRTANDTDSTASQRAQALENLLRNAHADDVVQGLFSAYRGSLILEQSDPRVSLYLRALRDGGGEVPVAERTRWALNGDEKVRLAAARVILDMDARGVYLNTGFSQADRVRALQVVAETAFSGSQDGYRQDAMTMLRTELNKPENPLLLVALSDIIRANPAHNTTIRAGERSFTVRQLLQHHLRAQAPENNPNGTRTVDTGRGEVTLQFRSGQLWGMAERLREGGREITTRRVWGSGMVIEEVRNGRLERALPQTGTTYGDILADDITDGFMNLQARLTAARRLFTSEGFAVTAQERVRGAESLNRVATTGTNYANRLEFSRYLAYGQGIRDTTEAAVRLSGYVAINELAAHADELVRAQAQTHVRAFTPEQTRQVMQRLAASTQQEITSAVETQRTHQRELDALAARISPLDRQISEEYLRRIGQPARQSVPLPLDLDRMARSVEQMSRLYDQSGRTPEAAASLLSTYRQASAFLQDANPSMQQIRAKLASAVELLATQPFRANDPRLADMRWLYSRRGDDELQLRIAQAVLAENSALRNTGEVRIEAIRQLGMLAGSANEPVRTAARQFFNAIPADNSARVREATNTLIRSGLELLQGSENPAGTARFWHFFKDHMERTNERTGQLYTLVQNRCRQFPLPASDRPAPVEGQPPAQPNRVADLEILAEEALTQMRNPNGALGLYQQALTERVTRDGANHVETVRARMRILDFLESHYRNNSISVYTIQRTINEQVSATAAALRAQTSPTGETADALLRCVQLSQQFNNSENGGQAVRDMLEDSRRIYAGLREGRNNPNYARCLSLLAEAQLRNNNPGAAQTTFNSMVELAGQEMPQADRARVLGQCFARANNLIARGVNLEANLTTARQLLGRVNGAELGGLNEEQATQLHGAIWWVGRTLSENGRPADSYQFFDRAIAVHEATLGVRGEFTGLLGFYLDVLRRNNQTERAQQIQTRLDAEIARIRSGASR